MAFQNPALKFAEQKLNLGDLATIFLIQRSLCVATAIILKLKFCRALFWESIVHSLHNTDTSLSLRLTVSLFFAGFL